MGCDSQPQPQPSNYVETPCVIYEDSDNICHTMGNCVKPQCVQLGYTCYKNIEDCQTGKNPYHPPDDPYHPDHPHNPYHPYKPKKKPTPPKKKHTPTHFVPPPKKKTYSCTKYTWE